MRRTISAMLMWTLTLTAATAQQIGQNAPAQGNATPIIAVSTQLVVETVVVKDKKGDFIEGLTAKDFTVSEDGVPQAIRFCEHQKLPETTSSAPVAKSEPESVKIYYQLDNTKIAPESPGDLRYKDRRLLALYFDMTAMMPAEQLRALEKVRRYPDDFGGSRFHHEIYGWRRRRTAGFQR